MTLKPLLWSVHHLLPWVLALLAAFVLSGNLSKRQSARDLGDGRIEFAPGRIVLGAWLLVIVYMFWTCAAWMMHGRWKFPNVPFAASFGLIAVTLLFSFPGAVVISRQGLLQTYWFRKNKCIRWEEIVEINTGGKSRTVTITGADGCRIVHSSQLPDRRRLLLELKERCGENLPPDFPREPFGFPGETGNPPLC